MEAVHKVYFFGSLKDGFKCYPNSSAYNHFYNNTPEGWVFAVRKYNRYVSYTFVQYGVITSINDGRSGSCFGIAIELADYYFYDLEKVRKEFIVNGILETMLKEKQLIRQYSDSQYVFVPFNLSQVAHYLDRWSQRIRKAVSEHLSDNLRLLPTIVPDAGTKLMGLHPASKPEVIQEYFETQGGINLSANYAVEHVTPSERTLRAAAQKQKDFEAQRRKYIPELEALLAEKDEIIRKQQEEIIELIQRFDKSNSATEPVNKEATANAEKKPTFWKEFFGFLPAGERTKPKEKVSFSHPFAIIPALLLVAIAATFLFMWDSQETGSGNSTTKTGPPRSTAPAAVHQENRAPAIVLRHFEDECVYTNQEQSLGMLRVSAFLEYAIEQSLVVGSLEDFRRHLTDYLFLRSEIVQIKFKSREELWDNIAAENPNSIRKIEGHIALNANKRLREGKPPSVEYHKNRYWSGAIKGSPEGALIIVRY